MAALVMSALALVCQEYAVGHVPIPHIRVHSLYYYTSRATFQFSRPPASTVEYPVFPPTYELSGQAHASVPRQSCGSMSDYRGTRKCAPRKGKGVLP